MTDIPHRKRTILLVDDHPIVFLGLKTLLEHSDDFQLSRSVSSNNEAIATAIRDQPDIAIVDLILPGRNGMEIIPMLKQHCPNCLIVVYSSMPDHLYAARSLQAGARAYVNKESGLNELVEAIKAVSKGDIHASPSVIQGVLKNYSSNGKSDNTITSLSNQELNVLRLIGSGMRLSEIAAQLNISPKTVGTHRERIKNKLNLSTGKELDTYAISVFNGGLL